MKIAVAVYDKKGEFYSTPKIMLTPGDAIRAFESEVKTQESPLKKFPEDFSLWQIGTWDERKGEFQAFKEKIHLSNAWELSQSVASQQ